MQCFIASSLSICDQCVNGFSYCFRCKSVFPRSTTITVPKTSKPFALITPPIVNSGIGYNILSLLLKRMDALNL